MAERILGIDPGTGRLGFGVIEIHGSKPVLVDGGVITTPPNSPEPQRLLTIFEELNQIITDARPRIMSVEKLFFARNITTAMNVSQARGVIMLLGEKHGLDIYEYTPLQIKMALTGYGRADKKQIQEMVRVVLNLKEVPQPDDCADALAAALAHAQTVRLK